jgi:hypothetical protein
MKMKCPHCGSGKVQEKPLLLKKVFVSRIKPLELAFLGIMLIFMNFVMDGQLTTESWISVLITVGLLGLITAIGKSIYRNRPDSKMHCKSCGEKFDVRS